MPDRERTCAMKNRMRQLRTCGTVRGEGHEVLAYSESVPSGGFLWITFYVPTAMS
jgi:hypothetical protein